VLSAFDLVGKPPGCLSFGLTLHQNWAKDGKGISLHVGMSLYIKASSERTFFLVFAIPFGFPPDVSDALAPCAGLEPAQ
jgi:hypothetical protein